MRYLKTLFSIAILAPLPTEAQVEVINLAESRNGWGRAAVLSRDAYEGQFAVAFDAPNDRTGFLSFDHRDTGVDISAYDRIAFWWKVKGEGLQDLKIKVRNYPLAGGMEAVYTIHSVGPAPTDWTLATAKVTKPQFDDWGGDPDLNRRYITFRTVTTPGSSVRLFIDRIVVLPETFTWSVGIPVFDPTAGPDVDFNGDSLTDFTDFLLFAAAFGTISTDTGFDARFDLDSDGQVGFTDFITFSQGFGTNRGRWDVPVSLTNRTGNSLSIAIGSGRSPIYTTDIGPGSQNLNIQLPPTVMAGRDASDSHKVALWAEVMGIAETRASRFSFVPQTGPSRTWQQFVNATAAGEEPILPRFSYAGYRHGEHPVPTATGTVFDVRDYGAIPDDGQSDHTAIQAAINAAEENGGGRVVFPAGRFLVNTDKDVRTQIRIQASNVVLQGAGSRQGGTVIQQINYMLPTQPENLWTSPYMFKFIPTSTSDPTLATITADSDRETFWISVDNSSKLNVGDRVKLVMTSTAAVNDFIAPYSPEPSWTALSDAGIRVREKHTIAEIDGPRVRLVEPLHTDVQSRYGWTITGYQHLERVGVEDICFKGTWKDFFVHHKDAIHDGGWSLVRMTRVADSWIRRCSFLDVNRAVAIGNSIGVSIYHVTQAGNKGHSSIAVNDSYGVWIGLTEDLAAHHHGPGSSGRSCGTVYWRYDMQPEQRIDAHGGQPYANLLDCVNGGVLYGSGASIQNLPNHLKHYTLWNFNHRGSHTAYDFWVSGPNARNRFVRPIVVGFHGDPVTFNEENLEVLESLGSPVEPASLYQAQLKLRLGSFPEFYSELIDEWQVIRNQPLAD
ncbi:MAG TPA: hypothetical protein DHW45_09215 [Candidatus Latescibacteria bacterium]|nr:hypothetical protein [Candidatus Latescibacterota bacterium]